MTLFRVYRALYGAILSMVYVSLADIHCTCTYMYLVFVFVYCGGFMLNMGVSNVLDTEAISDTYYH